MTAARTVLRGRYRRVVGFLPPGAMAVALGLVASSVSTYGFLVVSARVLGPEKYAPLSVLWSMVFLVVPATWVSLEQELARRVSRRRALDDGYAPVLRAGRTVAAVMAGLLVVAVAASAPFTIDSLFSGETVVVAALAVSAFAFAGNHLTRAVLAGESRFGRYGSCVAVDSATRLAGAVVLAAAGVRSPGPYALVIALAPLLPAYAFFPRDGGHRAAGTDESPALLAAAVAPLVGGQFLAQALLNGGAPVVALLATDGEQAVAARFLATLLIARVPLFFFMAIQSSLLPRLANLHATGDRSGFDQQLRTLLVGVVGLAATAVAVVAAAGVPIVELLFGEEYALGRRDLVMLATASGCYMVGVVAAQGVVALSGHRHVAFGWFCGVVVFAGGVVFGRDLLWRVEVGLVGGMATAAAVLLIALHTKSARWHATGGNSVS